MSHEATPAPGQANRAAVVLDGIMADRCVLNSASDASNLGSPNSGRRRVQLRSSNAPGTVANTGHHFDCPAEGGDVGTDHVDAGYLTVFDFGDPGL